MADPAPPPTAPPPPSYPRHKSYVGPIILIVLGVLFLTGDLFPGFDTWRFLWLFWPLILILIGVGKVWDIHYARQHPGEPARPHVSGTGVAWIIVLALFLTLAWHRSPVWDPYGWSWSDRDSGGRVHDMQPVEIQGAKSVSADLEMPAGQLTLAGGSSRLLDAEFDYEKREGSPVVDYEVSGDRGELSVKQHSRHSFFGNNDNNDWNLRFSDSVPIDLRIHMGAGQSDLRLNGMNLSGLEIHVGAGEMNLDLTGERKTSLQGEIHGGAGQATIRLPKNVGVRVDASGGIGAINAPGLKRDGDAYVNDLYGKTPSSINLNIHGGVGELDLVEE